jgi:uncharacterized protein
VAVLVWIARALVLLFILRFVLRLLFGARRPSPGRQAGGGRAPERVGGELVRDPQCGTYIPRATALSTGSGADLKYFCSTECRDAYLRRSR